MMMIMLLNTALVPAVSERSANSPLNHLRPFLYAYNPDSCSTADVALCRAPQLPSCKHYFIRYSHISLLTLDIHHFR
ncbi:hypothetical protein BKA56DRAFT_602378 [Ilyonectria sp. MPI-CAGE-AT-0026]|nr:hypothetical protein BKA56DRAFT_602378 [Ilyonectria sp. MPI-CAGE-AT-0026]